MTNHYPHREKWKIILDGSRNSKRKAKHLAENIGEYVSELWLRKAFYVKHKIANLKRIKKKNELP